MNAARIALIALACSVPLVASAQWIYLDKDGRKVFSDKAPPPEIGTDRIVKAPKGVVLAPAVATESTSAADLPMAAGKDKTLEDRRKQLAASEAAKKKAEDDKFASLRAENCTRARQAKNAYDSGQRIGRVDKNGERTFVSDSERATEVKRLEEVIARDCAQ